LSPEDGNATVVRTATDTRVGDTVYQVLPEHAAVFASTAEDVVGTLRDVHHPVNDDGRGLPGAEHLVGRIH
jgi:hypothetical protein